MLNYDFGHQVTVERSGKIILGEVDIQLRTNHPYPESKLFEYRVYKEDDLAVFRMDSFSPFNEYNKKVIQNFFETVKKEGVHQVAIDLRYNDGGSTMFGDYILSFLEIPSYRNLKTAVRYSTVVSQRVTGKPTEKEEMLYFDSGLVPVQPHENTFKGKLYIITSQDTYSAATALATVVKDNAIGMIVGEAPGGKPSSYGDILSFELPESKLRLFISFKWFERPSITLKNRYEDAAAGHLRSDHIRRSGAGTRSATGDDQEADPRGTPTRAYTAFIEVTCLRTNTDRVPAPFTTVLSRPRYL
ncbi:S41 family peptidase [Paenibacillus thiaminolyticus]|uniref:S41 family peptidase n=1 Tax=Paenibacillus thiaminolyticus TaxID=49283 RepID=UPI003D27DA48